MGRNLDNSTSPVRIPIGPHQTQVIVPKIGGKFGNINITQQGTDYIRTPGNPSPVEGATSPQTQQMLSPAITDRLDPHSEAPLQEHLNTIKS